MFTGHRINFMNLFDSVDYVSVYLLQILHLHFMKKKENCRKRRRGIEFNSRNQEEIIRRRKRGKMKKWTKKRNISLA